MRLWINEREVPAELLALLDLPDLPSELWQEIVKAKDEVTNHGAVTYVTKARVEFYVNKYADFLSALGEEHE